MAEDWSADVRKYVPEADDAVIAGIVRYCGIALRNRDSSLVAFSDAKETARVRDNFLKKKLGLTQSDEVLDQAIAAVGERMKGDRTKNRVTAYYLLADNFGKLELFRKSTSAKATGLGTSKAPATGGIAASSGLASLDGGMISKPAAKKAVSAKAVKPAEMVTPPRAPVETPQASASAGATPPPAPVAAAPAIVAASSPSAASAAASESKPSSESSPARPLADLPTTVVSGEASGMNWLPWLLLALAVLVLIWWLNVR